MTGRRASAGMAFLCVGTALNPLNSSMIAVALVDLRGDFALSAIDVTWVVTVFYLVSAVAQPLAGRVADAVGEKIVFVVGMSVALVAAIAGPLASTFVGVCVARAFLAMGTCVAFPVAVSLVGPISERSGRRSSGLLAWIQVANTAAAAIGPVLGGILLTLGGWETVFWVNVPLALTALIGTAVLTPASRPGRRTSPAGLARELDPVGVVGFAVSVTAVLLFVLGLP